MAVLVCSQCHSTYASQRQSGEAKRCPRCGTATLRRQEQTAGGALDGGLPGPQRHSPAPALQAAPRTEARHGTQDTLELAARGRRANPSPKDPIPKGTAAPSAEQGSAEPSAAEAQIRALGPYQIIEEIGRGGMGLVLRAKDPALKREVAIKILRSDARQDEQRRMRFIEEAQITGQLEHPGIAPVHFLSQDEDGREYFSMKLVSGQTLERILEQWHARDPATREDFPFTRLLSIFERVCETVGFAHARGIIHRDLKPANVMAGMFGEVWVLDWGLAKVLQKEALATGTRLQEQPIVSIRQDLNKGLTLDGMTVGTPEYMPPEQAKGEPLDERADIFGLGSVLYVLLTGHPPVRGKTVNAVVSNAALGLFTPVRRTGAGKHAPPALAAITEKCLAADRAQRYRSTRELLRDLRAYAAGDAVRALPDSALEKLLRFRRRHKRGVALAGGLAGLFLALLTASSLLLAKKDRQALAAQEEAGAQRQIAVEADTGRIRAELDRQKALAESSAQAQKRLRAFEPYAQAMDLLMRGQRADQAVELLERALGIDAGFPEARFALGEALRASGDPQRAAAAYLQADELSRKISGRPHLQAVIAAGFAYDGAGLYAQAEDAFSLAERHGANDPLALVGKVFSLAQRRKCKEARRVADEALVRAPHLWETHFAVGYATRELVEDGVLSPEELRKTSLPAFRRALELSPRQAETCVWLFRVLVHLGGEETPEALALVDRAIALEPKNGNRYLIRALARFGTGDVKGAEEDEAMARRLGASSLLLKQYQALLLNKKGDFVAVVRLTGELASESRGWLPLVCTWIVGAYSLGKFEEARPAFERMSRENPEYHYVFLIRAYLKKDAKDLQGAIAELKQGLSFAPYHRQLNQKLVEFQYLAGNYKEALDAANRTLELAPREYTAKTNRLKCLAALKRYDEGLAYLAQIEQDHPGQTTAIGTLRKQIEALKPPKK